MDVFDVRDRLIGDYREFTSSFVDPRDPEIRRHVERLAASGYQWPAPYLSLNPNFASGGTVDALVAAGLLHPDNERIFRLKDHPRDLNCQPLRLHQHQREAIATARAGHSYVLTTGTGSGKSLSYTVPIVDRVLRAKADGSYRPGVKAIKRTGQQSTARVGEIPPVGFPGRDSAGHVRPLHRPGEPGGWTSDSAGSTGHPAHQLCDAQAGADPAPGMGPPDRGRQRIMVPRPRRTAHLPGATGRLGGPGRPTVRAPGRGDAHVGGGQADHPAAGAVPAAPDPAHSGRRRRAPPDDRRGGPPTGVPGRADRRRVVGPTGRWPRCWGPGPATCCPRSPPRCWSGQLGKRDAAVPHLDPTAWPRRRAARPSGRGRRLAGGSCRQVSVTAQKPADVLGVYVYLPHGG